MSCIKTVLFAGVASFVLASSAQAEGNWYAGVGLGANWLDDTNGTFTAFPGTTLRADYETGWVMVGAVGYRWDNLRLEFELGYRDNASESVTTTPPIPNTLFSDVSYFSQMINLVWDIPLGERFRLSLGGGVGGALVDYDLGGILGIVPYAIDDDDYVFAYQAIAGLNVDISDRMELFAEYRYFNTDDFRVSGAALIPAFTDLNVRGDPENHSALIGVRYHFVPAPPPAPGPAPAAEAPPPKTYIVFFDFNKANLTMEAQSVVAEASDAFRTTGSARVLVVGHTDTVGSASYNQRLSERRAATVKAEMVRLGVPADAISIEGRGFSDPMVPTGPGVREPQNRRAVIDLQ